MTYEIAYTPSAKRTIKKLAKQNPKLAKQLLSFIEKQLLSNPLDSKGTKLAGFEGLYRLRKGDYRIIYSLVNQKLLVVIVKIDHRRDVYKSLSKVDPEELLPFLTQL